MLKQRFEVKSVSHMHYHQPNNPYESAGVVEGFTTLSFSTNTEFEAIELGKEKCKSGEWFAFTVDKFYYWEE